jgi:hypothetical protein
MMLNWLRARLRYVEQRLQEIYGTATERNERKVMAIELVTVTVPVEVKVDFKSKNKDLAYNVKGMRRGDIYISASDGAVMWRLWGRTDKLGFVSPFGEYWLIDSETPLDTTIFPAVRVYKQTRGDLERPGALD